MRIQVRGVFLESLKIAVLVVLFSLLENEVIEIRRDLHGNSNTTAEAQSRYTQELHEARKQIRSALDDSNLQFSQARKVFEESTEMIQDERRELARIIDDRTGALESTIRDRLEKERSLLEGAFTGTQQNAAAIQKLSGAPAEIDAALMKRKMVFPTVQLRGEGTVGSGVLVYSEPQPQGDARGAPSTSSGGGHGHVLTLILTAHHVVLEVLGSNIARGVVDEVRILSDSDAFETEVFKADLVAFDRDRDTALLRLRSDRIFPNVTEFASRETVRRIDIFTRAYAVGCPLGNRPLPTAGEISSKSKVVGDQVFWMLNAPTFFGNSGGGIYLASNCQLIGISSMIYTYGKTAPAVVPHMGLFVPLEALYDWLDAEGFSFVWRRDPAPAAILARMGIRKEAPPEAGKGQARVAAVKDGQPPSAKSP